MAKNKKYCPDGMVTMSVNKFEHYIAEQVVGKFNNEVLTKERNNLEAEVERLMAEVNALTNELTEVRADKAVADKYWSQAITERDELKKELEAEQAAHQQTKNCLKLEESANETLEAYIHADEYRAADYDAFQREQLIEEGEF